jgi:hypothetical protein
LSTTNTIPTLQWADNKWQIGKGDEDIPDILAEEPGGRYAMVPDEKGTILKLGNGVFRDLKTGHVFQGVKSDPKIGGNITQYVGDGVQRDKLKAKLVGKRQRLRKKAASQPAVTVEAEDDELDEDEGLNEDDAEAGNWTFGEDAEGTEATERTFNDDAMFSKEPDLFSESILKTKVFGKGKAKAKK